MDAAGDGGGGPAAQRKAENRNGKRRSEAFELLKGGLGIQLALNPVNAARAAAIAGVVKNQGCDTVYGQELLHGQPTADGFSDAVADEDCCARRATGGLDEYCVNNAFSALDGMPGGGLVGECTAWAYTKQIENAVSHNQEPNNASKGKSEGSAVVGHQTENPQLISAW